MKYFIIILNTIALSSLTYTFVIYGNNYQRIMTLYFWSEIYKRLMLTDIIIYATWWDAAVDLQHITG